MPSMAAFVRFLQPIHTILFILILIQRSYPSASYPAVIINLQLNIVAQLLQELVPKRIENQIFHQLLYIESWSSV